jgi:hypothetical protein
MADKISEDFEDSVQFLMKHTPYTEDNLLRKNIVEFLRIIEKTEAEQMALIAAQKERQR